MATGARLMRSRQSEYQRRRERCLREIAEVRRELLAGNPDVEGLCLALMDWSEELRLIERKFGLRAEEPATAGAGRARREADDAIG